MEERGGELLLAEAAATRGAMLGSTMVDAAFVAYYRDQVGAAEFDAWQKEYPREFVEVMEQWELVSGCVRACWLLSSSAV